MRPDHLPLARALWRAREGFLFTGRCVAVDASDGFRALSEDVEFARQITATAHIRRRPPSEVMWLEWARPAGQYSRWGCRIEVGLDDKRRGGDHLKTIALRWRALGFDGAVYVPRVESGEYKGREITSEYEWEAAPAVGLVVRHWVLDGPGCNPGDAEEFLLRMCGDVAQLIAIINQPGVSLAEVSQPRATWRRAWRDYPDYGPPPWRRYKCLILPIHHSGDEDERGTGAKRSPRGPTPVPRHRVRGYYRRNGRYVREYERGKQRFGAIGKMYRLKDKGEADAS